MSFIQEINPPHALSWFSVVLPQEDWRCKNLQNHTHTKYGDIYVLRWFYLTCPRHVCWDDKQDVNKPEIGGDREHTASIRSAVIVLISGYTWKAFPTLSRVQVPVLGHFWMLRFGSFRWLHKPNPAIMMYHEFCGQLWRPLQDQNTKFSLHLIFVISQCRNYTPLCYYVLI